jgi:ribonuclease Z
MKMTLLGTGGPRPDPRRQGPATVIRIGDENLLFDAGRGAATQLVRASVPITDVDFVFVTHHHFDHIGGLADVLFAAWNKGRVDVIRVFGPKGTAEIVRKLVEVIYSADVWYRLAETVLTDENLRHIREMIVAEDVEPGLVYDSGSWRVYTEHVEHGHALGMSQEEWPCLGYRVEAEGKAITISGDAVDCPGLQKLARGATLLLQGCYLASEEIVDGDLRLIADHVLASSSMVGKIASKAGVGRLVLNHIKEKPLEMLRSMAEEIREDYDGPVVIGEDLMEFEV